MSSNDCFDFTTREVVEVSMVTALSCSENTFEEEVVLELSFFVWVEEWKLLSAVS